MGANQPDLEGGREGGRREGEREREREGGGREGGREHHTDWRNHPTHAALATGTFAETLLQQRKLTC